MTAVPQYAGQAKFRNGMIEIRVPIKHLPAIVRGMFNARGHEADYKVSDPFAFAVAVVGALNEEDESGTTPVHRMFDAAFDEAVNQGADGVELIEAGGGKIDDPFTDPSKADTIFYDHTCYLCKDGELPCRKGKGNERMCDTLRARND